MNFIDVIFCDDIRQEINNKISLIGVYSDQLVLNINGAVDIIWPQPINLSALFRFSMDKNEIRPDHFALEYILNKKTILQANGEIMNLNDKTQFHLIVNAMAIPFEPGYLGIKIKLLADGKILFAEEKDSVLSILVN